MLLLFSLAVLGTAITTVCARDNVVVEQLASPPQGWNLDRAAKPSDTLRLSIALQETGIDALKARLARASDPTHAEYGQHMSQAEVLAYRQPDRGHRSDLYGWLRTNGVPNARVDASFIHFQANASTIKALFEADLAYYAYNSTTTQLRTLSYTIPSKFRDGIKFVHPLTHFLPPRHSHMRTAAPKAKAAKSPGQVKAGQPEQDLPCYTGTYPDCIKQLYNITYNQTSPSPARIAVAGFLDQYINYGDVHQFMHDYAPDLSNLTQPYTFSVELLNNGSNVQDPSWAAGLEASVDVEYALALSYPANVTYYSTGGRGAKLNSSGGVVPADDSDNEPYLELFESLLAKPDGELPHVLSISYADDEQSVPEAYARQVCDLMASLTARGVTIVVATGDNGVAGTGQYACITNDAQQRNTFLPTFPASCPYVTAIGATDNIGPPVRGALYSGGGFSNYFQREDWQDTDVGPYVQKMVEHNDERLGLYNPAGRAIPDISAIGSAFEIQVAGSINEVLGTSASTPVVASMLALVNDARLRAGKNSTGWINPLLYSAGVRGTLLDIVHGANSGCDFPDGSSAPGFNAVPGYDCVTGLGTVDDFTNFLAALM